uniref:Uncharacterized protein n=1 Tax=Timema poppense TaxID=170557 RepID=A0A7R9H003_TIMPO|nr:unnamed protein product [Timema poppensis]
MDSGRKQEKSNPRDKASFLSILMFWWTFPIFWKGFRKDFGEEDLCGPRVSDLSTKLGDRLEKNWSGELRRAKENHSTPKFLIAILKTFRWEMIAMGLLDSFKDIVPRWEMIAMGLLDSFKDIVPR